MGAASNRPTRSEVLKAEIALGLPRSSYSRVKYRDYVEFTIPRHGVGYVRDVTMSGHVADVEEIIGAFAGVSGLTSLPARGMRVLSKEECRAAILEHRGPSAMPDDLKTAEERGEPPRFHDECQTCHHEYCGAHHGMLESSRSDWEFFCRCGCKRCYRDPAQSISWGCCKCGGDSLRTECRLSCCRGRN